MTTAPPIRTDVIDAVVAMLAAATLKPTWGPDGPDPTVDASSLLPYLVVEPAAGGAAMGSVGAPDDTAEIVVQVTAVGETVTSALIAMDAARTALLERDGTGDGFSNPITAPHMYVMARAWDGDGGTIVEGGIVNVVERFRLTVVAPPIDDDGVEGGVPNVEVDDVLDGGTP